MGIFKVSGKIRTTAYCECEYCPGHQETVTVKDRLIEARDAEDAADSVLEFYNDSKDDEDDTTGRWIDGPPKVIDVEWQQDVLMRERGAPTLPGIE